MLRLFYVAVVLSRARSSPTKPNFLLASRLLRWKPKTNKKCSCAANAASSRRRHCAVKSPRMVAASPCLRFLLPCATAELTVQSGRKRSRKQTRKRDWHRAVYVLLSSRRVQWSIACTAVAHAGSTCARACSLQLRSRVYFSLFALPSALPPLTSFHASYRRVALFPLDPYLSADRALKPNPSSLATATLVASPLPLCDVSGGGEKCCIGL